MLKGSIHFTKPQTNFRENNFIKIEVRDELSRTHFLEIEMTLEDFANAIITNMTSDCLFETRGLDRVGKLRKSKEELVPIEFSRWDQPTEEMIKKALEPFEKDGWVGSLYDFQNSNRYHEGVCRVSFNRWRNEDELNSND